MRLFAWVGAVESLTSSGTLLPKEVYVGLLKSFIFGTAIATVSCAAGLKANGGALGVGRWRGPQRERRRRRGARFAPSPVCCGCVHHCTRAWETSGNFLKRGRVACEHDQAIGADTEVAVGPLLSQL